MIRKVEGFGAQLQRLAFSNRERPRESKIQLKHSWTPEAQRTKVPVRAGSRRGKGCRIEPAINRLVGQIRIREHLIGTLGCRSIQSIIDARGHGEGVARPDFHDRRDLPVAADHT